MQDVVVRPISHDFLLWRCPHRGPLSKDTIDRLPEERRDKWLAHRALNVSLLVKLTGAYDSCAMLAWDGEEVVGFPSKPTPIMTSISSTRTLARLG